MADGAGLYIHVPFCTSVCPYCDFSVLIAGEERRASYVEAVLEEARTYADLGLHFDTVYFGGGTPSSLAIGQLERLVTGLNELLQVDSTALMYLEVNPEDVTPRAAAEWRRLGFSTVSLGVQSFSDEVLELLGRRHSAEQAIRAADTLKVVGFATVSLDLLYGVPGQAGQSWLDQLHTALALEADHLSCYQLTVHPGTVFGRRKARGELAELAEEERADLFFATHRALAEAGYLGYEVSSFAATARHTSVHNRKYWDHSPYLGLGPSAHSFVGGRRWWNHRKLRLWERAIVDGEAARGGEEILSADDLILETIMLALRTRDGLDLDALRRRFGIDLQELNRKLIDQLVEDGRLRFAGTRLLPTLEGLAVADSMAALFEF